MILPDINIRFLDVVKEKNYTGYRLAKEVDEISESKLTHIRKGVNKVSQNLISALLKKFPDVDATWLLTGKGNMLASQDESTVKESKSTYNRNEEVDTNTGYYFPDVSASAGLEKALDNTELVRIPITIPNWGKDLTFINVFGDSMYPKYCSGEIIGLKKIEYQYLNYGYAYVIVMNDGEVYLKYIKKGKDEEHLLLVSENKGYDPREFNISLIKSLFIVKGVITKITM